MSILVKKKKKKKKAERKRKTVKTNTQKQPVGEGARHTKTQGNFFEKKNKKKN